jgi:fructokinase
LRRVTEPDLYGAIEGGGTKFVCAVGPSTDQLHDQIRIDTAAPIPTLTAVLRFFEPYRARLRALGVACFGPLELNPARGERFGALLATP